MRFVTAPVTLTFLRPRQMAVNLKAVMNVSQIVAEGMIARGKGGSIVNVSSMVRNKLFLRNNSN